MIDSDGTVVKALGSRGLDSEWGPRDPDFFPQGGEEDPSSVLMSLDLVSGEGGREAEREKRRTGRGRERGAEKEISEAEGEREGRT